MQINNKLWRKHLVPYIYMLPALLLLAFIYLNSLIKVMWYSIVQWDGFTATNKLNWFDSYKNIFSNSNFILSFKNSIIILLIVIPVLVLLAIFATQFIYMGIKGHNFYKVVFYIPVVLPVIVVGIVSTFILNIDGPINMVLRFLGLDFLCVDWFGDPKYSLFGLIITVIWKDIGFAIVLFLAKLMGVSPYLYESAQIEGATEWEQMWYITIPQLSDVITLYTVLSCIGLLSNLFNYVFVTTGGGPGYSSTVVEYFIYLHTFNQGSVGEGAAVAVVLFIVTAVLSALYLKIYDKEPDVD